MEVENPAEHMYHFFLMGLAWLREDRPHELARRGSGIFWSYEGATPAFRSSRALAMISWDLAELVKERSFVYEGEKPPSTRQLKRLIVESDKHNIILAVPPKELQPEILFGPKGYSHVITNAGMAFAADVAGLYSELITRDDFMTGWAKYRDRMQTFNAKQSDAAG